MIKGFLELWKDKKAVQLHSKFENMNIPAEPKCAQKRAIKNGKTKDYILFALCSYSLCRFFSSCVVPWLKWKTFLEDFWHCSDEESGVRRSWRTPTAAGVTLVSNKSSDSIKEWKKLIMKRQESSGRRRTLTNTHYNWDGILEDKSDDEKRCRN